MSYKKWTFTGGQNRISSHVSVGMLHPGSFDQMKSASVIGGYNTDIRHTPRSMSCYTVTGNSPFVGYYYATEVCLGHIAVY